MNSTVLQHLAVQLDDLARHIRGDDCSWFRQELRRFANLVLVQIGRTLNLSDTWCRLENLAFPTLRSLRKALAAMKLDFARCMSIRLRSGCEAHPHQLIQDIECAIDAIGAARADVNTRVAVRETVVLHIEAKLQMLLACYVAQRLTPVFLRQCVCESLMATGETHTTHVLQLICKEVAAERECDEWRSTAGDYLRAQDFDTLRLHIAEYMTSPRPARVTHLAEQWESLHALEQPEVLPGLGIIIMWKDQASSEAPLIHDQEFGHSLARVDNLLNRHYNMSSDDIALMLRLRGLGVVRLVVPPMAEDDTVSAAEQLVFALRDLLRAADRLADKKSSLLHWVRQYKLMLEARAPDLFAELATKREDYLKRHLAGFLLGRNFSAAGTSFSTSATDLVARDDGVDYVLEAKVIRRSYGQAGLKRDLVQIHHYLSQQNPSALGVLLLYNFAPVSIVGHSDLIGGRCLMLPVNLHPAAPSRRRRALLIRPGRGSELIEVMKIGSWSQ